jgi:hypothetical protein
VGLELVAYIVIAAGGAVTLSVIFYLKKIRKKVEKVNLQPLQKPSPVERWRQRTHKSVTSENVEKAEEELRTLTLEREILSDAIRHLYEAHAEGKITEEEREILAERYKSRMMKVRDAISENESVVALHELEIMQDDLTKLFNERFDELGNKIDELRDKIGIEIEEAIVPTPIRMPTQIEEESPPKKRRSSKSKKRTTRKTQKSRKTAAEERIEKIRSDVEKVLNRLEQMEAEA